MGDPELYLFDPSDLPGAAEYRAERARRLAESRRRAHGAIEAALADTDADPAAAAGAVFRALLTVARMVVRFDAVAGAAKRTASDQGGSRWRTRSARAGSGTGR